MKTLTAKGTKCSSGRLTMDLARAEPVAVVNHRRPTVVVMAVKECERLMALELIKTFVFSGECNH